MTEPERQMQAVDGLIAEYRHMQGATLPLLHAVQDTLGFIPAAAMPRIAQALNLSRAEVHGVVSFYQHFRTEPAGRQRVQLCRAEACQSMGADALWQHACASLRLDAAAQHGGTTTDGRTTLVPVYCLGLCAMAPAMAVDGQPHGRVQTAEFDRLVARNGEAA